MIDLLCLDANVWIKILVYEDPPALRAAARRLLTQVELGSATLIAPAFSWAEVGSVLRKKIRTAELTEADGRDSWQDFLTRPIAYVDTPRVRARAWEIADQYGLPTLYDAAYLACAELADAEDPGQREFWTADDRLLAQLGDPWPPYVHRLQ